MASQKKPSTLLDIPIYRLLLEPKSFLLENTPDISLIDLAKQLPNSKNIHHEQEMKNKNTNLQKQHYLNYLLIETKVFCNEMLKRTRLMNSEYETALKDKILDNLFNIIFNNQIIFFKNLVLEDIRRFKLETHYYFEEINKATSIDQIKKWLRGHTVNKKLLIMLGNELCKTYPE